MARHSKGSIKNIKLLADQIPANSALMRYDKDLRERIVNDILSDKPIASIRKALHADGYEGITDQQLRRLKRNIIPVWNLKSEPRIVFNKDIENVLDNLEYLLDMQMKRIVEAMEKELEEQDKLYPIKYIDPELIPGLSNRIERFYDGTLGENEEKALLSMMEYRGRNELLFKEINSYHKTVVDYLNLRQQLGDENIKLKKLEKTANIISIRGTDEERKKIETKMKEKILKNVKETKT